MCTCRVCQGRVYSFLITRLVAAYFGNGFALATSFRVHTVPGSAYTSAGSAYFPVTGSTGNGFARRRIHTTSRGHNFGFNLSYNSAYYAEVTDSGYRSLEPGYRNYRILLRPTGNSPGFPSPCTRFAVAIRRGSPECHESLSCHQPTQFGIHAYPQPSGFKPNGGSGIFTI